MYELEITFTALFIGCFLRLVFPYLRQPKGTKFDQRYIGTAVSALIVSLLMSSFLITSIEIPDGAVPKIILFATALLQGWGATDIINKLGIDWRSP